MNFTSIRPFISIAIAAIFAVISVYFLIEYNTSLTARELLLIQAAQFASSLWFGWSVSYLFSAAGFHEQQKKFAISAYRRITDIDNSIDRIISRIKSKTTSNKPLNSELSTINEMVIGLRRTVKSSRADWADIIGEEINTIDKIQHERHKIENYNATDNSIDDKSVRLEKIEKMLSSLPSSLQIQTRFNIEDDLSYITYEFEQELNEIGFVVLEAFWCPSLDRDIAEFPIGSVLNLHLNDAGTRIGTLISHDEHGNKVGVVQNSTTARYHDFYEGLSMALKKSKFTGKLVSMGSISLADASDPDDEERHYFTLHVK